MIASIPSIQQGAVLQNPGDRFTVTLRNDLPVGNPGPNEILVKLSCTGLCHSEVRAVLGWGSYNAVIGHEGVGTVVKFGPNVSPSLQGARVGVKWLYSACEECSVCRRGYPQNCVKQLNTSRHVPGTLQQYVIADARFISRIQDGVPDEIAAPLLCAGLTMAGALSHLQKELQPGDWLVISGSGGGLGHIGVQLAARVNKLRVLAVDSGDDKKALSLASGAEAFIDYRTEDVAARVQDLTGEGAHATIVVPGTKEALQTAALVVRNMGYIITVGLPRNDVELPISATVCAARGLTIKGSSVGTEEQMDELLQLALRGVIEPSISIFNFSETPRLIHGLIKDEISGKAVVKIPA